MTEIKAGAQHNQKLIKDMIKKDKSVEMLANHFYPHPKPTVVP
jgi:hypothetical protein